MSIESYLLTVITLAGVYAILALSLNLQFGFTGLINFGIVAYFAAGAYAYTIVTTEPPSGFDSYRFGFGAPVWAGVLAAGAAGLLFALITGWPTLRLRGDYLALTTFAFAEMLHSVVLNERTISNGSVGFTGIERPLRDLASGSDYRRLLAGLMALAAIATYVVVRRLTRAPFGTTLKAIRDDEQLVALAGKRVPRYRLQVFLVGGLLAGLAGAMYTWFSTLVAPTLFTADVTFTVWIALVVGGIGSNAGALIGPVVLIGFEEAIRFLDLDRSMLTRVTGIRTALIGLLLIVLIRVRPASGGWQSNVLVRWYRRRPGRATSRVSLMSRKAT